MNPFKDLLETGIKKAKESRQLNQSPPEPRPYRNPDEELMHWRMQSLQYEMQDKMDKKNKINANTTILSCDSHSSKKSLEELKSIGLRDMKVPMVHKDRYLVAQVIGMPFAVVGVNTLIQDLNGDVEDIAIYNYRYKLDNLEWLYPGRIFVIKEPWLRYGSQSKTASLRVDSPSDIIFVDNTDLEFLTKIGAKQWYVPMSKDSEVWRKMANDSFKEGKFDEALNLYNRAIRCNSELPVLYLNKSLTCLRIDAFYEAYEAAKIARETDGDREKALYRMGQAAYGMREWQNAANNFADLLQHFPKNKLASEHLERANARIAEEKTGKFDFKLMLLESQKESPEIDVSDYKGPIEIVQIPGKGRGVIASRDIKEGTLLVVSKAFGSGYDQDYSGYLITINLIRNSGGTAAQMLQTVDTMQKLKNNPKRAKEIYDLYGGDEIVINEEIPFGVIDAARIQGISACNRFASDDLTADEKLELGKRKSATSNNSHLFILPSYFNHSCLANAHRTFYGNVMVIHANTNIKKGEEICLSYKSPLIEYSERTKNLKAWNFECHCELCEIDAKDKNCSKRNQLFEEFSKFSLKNNPENVIAKGEPLLEKIRESYANRDKFKITLIQMLIILAQNYFNAGFPSKSIDSLEEVLTLTNDSPLKQAVSIAHVYVNLGHCYLTAGDPHKVKELIQKAMDTSFCTDIEHFKLLFPEIAQDLHLIF